MGIAGNKTARVLAFVIFLHTMAAGRAQAASYSLSFVIQPSDIVAGSSIFATTVLVHPNRDLIASNAVQFQLLDANGKPTPDKFLQPVTTDSRGLAVFAETIEKPGKDYVLVASCRDAVIRSHPFDVVAPPPSEPPAPNPVAAYTPRADTPSTQPEPVMTGAAPSASFCPPPPDPEPVAPVASSADCAPRDGSTEEGILIPNPSLVKETERYPF